MKNSANYHLITITYSDVKGIYRRTILLYISQTSNFTVQTNFTAQINFDSGKIIVQ